MLFISYRYHHTVLHPKYRPNQAGKLVHVKTTEKTNASWVCTLSFSPIGSCRPSHLPLTHIQWSHEDHPDLGDGDREGQKETVPDSTLGLIVGSGPNIACQVQHSCTCISYLSLFMTHFSVGLRPIPVDLP